VAAAVAVRRAAGALDVPLVAVLGGPRCEVIEGLIEEQDLVLVVAGEPDGPLVRLAVGSCAGAAVAHRACSPGPARWIALAGLAGAHGLAGPVRGLVRELAVPPAVEEAAW
jgi:H+/gluconate symporter-like permease